MLRIINHPCFHGGQWFLKTASSYDGKDLSHQNILTWMWTQNTTCKVVVINYSNQRSKFKLFMDKLPKTQDIRLKDEFLNTFLAVPYDDLKNNGLTLDFAPYDFKIFSVDF